MNGAITPNPFMAYLTGTIPTNEHFGHNMKSIELKYKRFGINFNVSASLPERWSELTAGQLIAIVKNHSAEISEIELLAAFLSIKKDIVAKLTDFQRYSIAVELEFLQDFKPLYSFTIRTIKGLNAPRPRLEGMSFGQFIYVDTYHEIAVTTDDNSQLDKFIACLYLPENKQFDEKLIQDHADFVAIFIRPEEKTAISLNYRLVKEWICKQYPLLFQASEPETSDLEETQSTKNKRGSDWVNVYESLVGDDIVNQDKYAELPLHTVFRYLTTKIKENARR